MTDENDIIKTRREKLARWRAEGNAFANHFRRDALASELHRPWHRLLRSDGRGRAHW